MKRELRYCENCKQMTNHEWLNCLKCKNVCEHKFEKIDEYTVGCIYCKLSLSKGKILPQKKN